MLLRMSEMPSAVIRLVFPTGAPWSTMDERLFSAQASHAAIPAFSLASRCAASIACHASMSDREPVKMARRVFMVSPLGQAGAQRLAARASVARA